MAELTFRFPSKAVQYGFVEYKFQTDNLTPGEIAKLYVEQLVEYQSAEIDTYKEVEKRAREGMLSLGGKVVAVEENPKENPPPSGASSEDMQAAADEVSAPPWQAAAPAVSPKPWENNAAPKFNFK
jgi:hypothetical protein